MSTNDKVIDLDEIAKIYLDHTQDKNLEKKPEPFGFIRDMLIKR